MCMFSSNDSSIRFLGGGGAIDVFSLLLSYLAEQDGELVDKICAVFCSILPLGVQIIVSWLK